jgi:colicin import membrane protein
MARKLRVYQTSLGFYDLAIAAPSMQAALEAWGADSNLFHQGVAKESNDPEVVAATMSKPGIILRRPVGSDAPFRENAELPTYLAGEGSIDPTRPAPGGIRLARSTTTWTARPLWRSRGNRDVGKVSAGGRRSRERRRESAASTQSPRRKQPWKRPNGNMPSGLRPSTPRAPPSKKDRKPRTRVGRSKTRSCRALCVGREISAWPQLHRLRVCCARSRSHEAY